MTAQSPGTVARFVYNAYGTREFEKVAEWIAADAVLTNAATGDEYSGPEGYLQLARAWSAAFPDLRVEIGQVGAGEDTAVIEYTFRGTHTGALISPGGFIPPTWAQVELRLCDSLQLREGKVVRIASYFDTGTMLRQMGLLPNSPLHAAERRAALGLYATEVDSSSGQRNKAIVQRFLEEVLNQRNPGAASTTCAPELAWHGGSLGDARDLPCFQSILASLFASFPDLHLELHDVIAEEDRVAVRVTLHGTQLGDFQGIAPTGKRIASSGLNSFRINSSRIVEGWWQHDLLGLIRQLNAVPAVAKGGA
jgi:predicted ester cyclase